MTVTDKLKIGLAAVLCLAFIAHPRLVVAQGASTSSIAGVVRDTSGAVLPGVTVEASSPVLIEKTRSTVTDGDGRYRITELRAGTYSVSFTLPGFSTLVRDQLVLPVSFTATINVELSVGGLNETVTVSGESPLVDVTNVSDQARISRTQIDALPSNRSLFSFAAFTPAIVSTPRTQDVGGSQGESRAAISIHGSRDDDAKVLQEGLRASGTLQQGGMGRYFVNPLAVTEVLIELGGGGSAEQSTGGAQVNAIPLDGGNRLKGTFFVGGTTDKFQRDNVTSDLEARGLVGGNSTHTLFDLNSFVGGPLLQNRIWFTAAFHGWGRTQGIGDLFEDANLDDWVYTPDKNKPVLAPERDRHYSGRVTVQLTRKDKVTGSYDWQYYRATNNQGSLGSGTRAWEVKGNKFCQSTKPIQATWTRPQSNKILFEGGISRTRYGLNGPPWLDIPICDDNPDRTLVQEQNVAVAPANWHGTSTRQQRNQNGYNGRLSASYVTGSHNVKVGTFLMRAHSLIDSTRLPSDVGGLPVAYRFNNGVANRITQYVTPATDMVDMAEIALFAQDQWTLKRLSLNYGVRFEQIHEGTPVIDLAAGPFNDARVLPKTECIPCWDDISPRFAVSYDVFGTGKTAVKGSVGKYLASATIDPATQLSPLAATTLSTTRSWTDTNNNHIPNCDLRSPLAQNLSASGGDVCGAMADNSFGQNRVRLRADPDWITGWGKRRYNWESSLALQQQVGSRMAVSAEYHQRLFGNQIVTENSLVAPADYNPFCVTAPTDARLGSVSGTQVCGLYDLNPAKFGLVDSVTTLTSNFGDLKEWFRGFDLGVQGRLPRGAQLNGGVSWGNSLGLNAGTGATTVKSRRCFVVDSPQELFNCESGNPMRAQIKLNGSVPLPGEFVVAAVYQSLPPPNFGALTTYTSAQIAPSLGRPLSGGTANVVIDLLQPLSTFNDQRVQQLDLRLSKKLTLAGVRMQLNLDMYNALNIAPVLDLESTYGSTWQRPNFILDGTLFKFGAQIDF